MQCAYERSHHYYFKCLHGLDRNGYFWNICGNRPISDLFDYWVPQITSVKCQRNANKWPHHRFLVSTLQIFDKFNFGRLQKNNRGVFGKFTWFEEFYWTEYQTKSQYQSFWFNFTGFSPCWIEKFRYFGLSATDR